MLVGLPGRDCRTTKMRERDALGRGRTERGAHRVLVVALAEALDCDLVQPGKAVFERAQRLLQALLKLRPIAIASPTDFIEVVRIGSAPGNFSNAKRGILVTTQSMVGSNEAGVAPPVISLAISSSV